MAMNSTDPVTLARPDGTRPAFSMLVLVNSKLPESVRLRGDLNRTYSAMRAADPAGPDMSTLLARDIIAATTPGLRAEAWAAAMLVVQARAPSKRRPPATAPTTAPSTVIDDDATYTPIDSSDEPDATSTAINAERSTDQTPATNGPNDRESTSGPQNGPQSADDDASDESESADTDTDSADSDSDGPTPEQAQADAQEASERQSERDSQRESDKAAPQPQPNPMEAALEPFVKRLIAQALVDYVTHPEACDLDAVTLGRAVSVARRMLATYAPQLSANASASAASSTLTAPAPWAPPIVAAPVGLHPLAGKVLALMTAGANVYMVGGAGVGKTTLAEQIAKHLSVRFYGISLSEGTPESAVLGRSRVTLDPTVRDYVPSQFVECCGMPSVILLDECDGMNANMGLVMNAALANRWFFNPVSNERVDLHPDCRIIAAANTWGHGATVKFRGRNALDGAFLDRFYAFELPRNRALELAATGRDVPDAERLPAWRATARKGDDKRMGEWLDKVRAVCESSLPNRAIEFRAYQRASVAYKVGIGYQEFRRDFLGSWRADELAKLGALANVSAEA